MTLPSHIPLSEFLIKKKNYLLTSNEYVWIEYENFSFVRYPFFYFAKPKREEIDKIFQYPRALVINYSEECSEQEANARWYVCKNFNPETIHDSFLKSIKRAKKVFTVRNISHEELFQSGYAAFSETRKRVGLNDYSYKDFRQRYAPAQLTSTYNFIGAFKENNLIAFLSVLIANDFAEIEGAFSSNESLKDCPNDLLVYSVLNQCLHIQSFSLVSYGLSSIQENTGEEGLHRFKTKCGFDAIPVKRVFLAPRKLQWIIHPVKYILKLMLKIFPDNRIFRKANGIFNYELRYL